MVPVPSKTTASVLRQVNITVAVQTPNPTLKTIIIMILTVVLVVDDDNDDEGCDGNEGGDNCIDDLLSILW